MSISPGLAGLLLYNLANPAALLSVPPEHLHSGLAAQLADATARADAVEMRLERLEPLADDDALCLPALQAEAKRLTEQIPFMSEIDRFRGYIDPLWAESVRFAEAAFRHAGINHEEWPLVSAETDLQDAKSWFTERANELSDGITSVQNTANEAAVTAQKTAVDTALATQKQELKDKAKSAQASAIEIALAAYKQGIGSTPDSGQQAAVDKALAAQKDDLDSKAQSAQDAAIEKALAAQKQQLELQASQALKAELDEQQIALEAKWATAALQAQRQSHCDRCSSLAATPGSAPVQEDDNVDRAYLLDSRSDTTGIGHSVVLMQWHHAGPAKASRPVLTCSAEADAVDVDVVKVILGLSERIRISPPELWIDVTAETNHNIKRIRDSERLFRTQFLQIAEKFARDVSGVQQHPRHQQSGVPAADLKSLKQWFSLRRIEIDNARLAREREMFHLLLRFAQMATGKETFPVELVAGCNLSAFDSWLADRTSEVVDRLWLQEKQLNTAISIAHRYSEEREQMLKEIAVKAAHVAQLKTQVDAAKALYHRLWRFVPR